MYVLLWFSTFDASAPKSKLNVWFPTRWGPTPAVVESERGCLTEIKSPFRPSARANMSDDRSWELTGEGRVSGSKCAGLLGGTNVDRAWRGGRARVSKSWRHRVRSGCAVANGLLPLFAPSDLAP